MQDDIDVDNVDFGSSIQKLSLSINEKAFSASMKSSNMNTKQLEVEPTKKECGTSSDSDWDVSRESSDSSDSLHRPKNKIKVEPLETIPSKKEL